MQRIRSVKKTNKPLYYMLLFTGLILLFVLLMQPIGVYHFREYIDILFPKGQIAREERNLLFVIQGIMLLVVIPVYILTFIFSWKYRARSNNENYDPDLVDNVLAEYIWWGLPLVLTIIISVITWNKTHELDPYKPIVSPNKPITIQVVALQWKWLFIYPEEGIATVNYIQIPEQTPIHFEITADAPMNSFWIPHLGGQIYAMPAMKTELHLIADHVGDFRGSSANLSGEGFAGMHFITRASSATDYQTWVDAAKASTKILDLNTYAEMAAPSSDSPVEIYQLGEKQLFHKILMKFMHPQAPE